MPVFVLQIFGIYPQKGYIGVGSDADIAVLNPNATKRISVEGSVWLILDSGHC